MRGEASKGSDDDRLVREIKTLCNLFIYSHIYLINLHYNYGYKKKFITYRFLAFPILHIMKHINFNYVNYELKRTGVPYMKCDYFRIHRTVLGNPRICFHTHTHNQLAVIRAVISIELRPTKVI